MGRIRDLGLVTLKTLEGSRLVSETLEMFIAGVQAIALILTVRGGTEERDLIGWYFSFAFDLRDRLLQDWVYKWNCCFCKFSIELVIELGTWLLTISCCCCYGGNPRSSTLLVDGTLVLGFFVFEKGALHMAPSCAWVAPVRGVGDLGESGVPF